jgi:hypothetical protein
MQFDFKKARIDIFVIIGFALLSLIYCYPQLEGKKLTQTDNVSWQGMAREGMAYHDSTGKDVLWSNSMFGGMPSYTSYVATSNTNFLASVQTVLQAIGKPAYFFFIAMLGFYVLMRILKVNKWLGVIGAIAYAFSTYNPIIVVVGHDTKMLTMGYLPVAIGGLYLIFKEKWLQGAAIFGLSMVLIFINNHFQVVYYALIMFVCFGVVMLVVAIKEGRIKQFLISAAVAAVTFAIGVGPAMPSVLSTQEYAKETMRGGASELSGHDQKKSGGLDKEYAFRWSNGIGETFCLMIPYLYGGASGEPAEMAPKTLEGTGGQAERLPLYWGPQPGVSGPVYFGAIICFLFVLGMMVVRSPHKWWIIAASFICIILSTGKHMEGINYFLFDNLPYLNKFRTPSMALVIPELLFPLLGIWGLQEIIGQKDKKKIWKQVMVAAGITGGICLILGVMGGAFFDFTGYADAQYDPQIVKLLKEDRASLAAKSCFKSAAFILIAAGLLWAYLNEKIKLMPLIAGIGILVVIDLIPMANHYLNADDYVEASDYERVFEPRPADAQILRDPDPYYRVLDLSRDTYNDAVQAYFHKCVGGYHPAKMEIYQDLIDRNMFRDYNMQVLNMLNTKYIIFPLKEPTPLPNKDACGNAWFVSSVKWAKTADEEMALMRSDSSLSAEHMFYKLRDAAIGADTNANMATVPSAGFKPKEEAIMRETFKGTLGNYAFGKDANAYVKLARYGLNEISFTSNNSQPGLAVFSDIYYDKGWKAFVDGKETPIMKANYVLRAIMLPAGSHNIEFRFHPTSFYNGKTISLISSILMILVCAGAIYVTIKKDKGETPKAA